MLKYYEVTIKRVEDVPAPQLEWKKVADTGNERDGGPVYDYVTYEGTTEVEREVLRQQVDTLDVAAVIRAVNGL